MMMTAGAWIIGAVFCLLGLALLATLVFVAVRYLAGDRPTTPPTSFDTADVTGARRQPEF